MKKFLFAVCAAAVVLVGGATPPSSATVSGGTGSYDRVQFTNNTDWCVWLTIYLGGGLPGLWSQYKAENVRPHTSIKEPFFDSHVKLLAQLWAKGDCSGGMVGSTNISKTATTPSNPEQTIQFGAISQLDHYSGGFNFYWGADTVDSATTGKV